MVRLLFSLMLSIVMALVPFDAPQTTNAEGDLREKIAASEKFFTQLGLKAFSDGEIEQIERSYDGTDRQFDEYLALRMDALINVGIGCTNYDTREWTPASNAVYAFDAEVFDLDRMYTNFLQGVNSISLQEDQITDIVESPSVDWLAGKGEQPVLFTYRGHEHSFTAKINYDWFDENVLGYMNDIYAEEGCDRRLCSLSDSQIIILVFKTPAWADAFTNATGLKLYTGRP